MRQQQPQQPITTESYKTNYDAVTAIPQTSFSDAEIKKFLDEKGFSTAAASTAAIEPVVITAEVTAVAPVSSSNDDLRSPAVWQSKEEYRQKVILVLCFLAMCVGLILASTCEFEVLDAWMLPNVVIQALLFATACIFGFSEYKIKHKFTELVDDDGRALVLQIIAKRFRIVLLPIKSYHLLVQYRVQGRTYLKILHVTKAVHDWTKVGDVISPLRYIPSKPKTAIAAFPRHKCLRRRVMVTSLICTILHFTSLILWIVHDAADQNADGDAWFFFFLTLGLMAFSLLYILARTFAWLRLKLEDFITIHEATAVTEDDHSTLAEAKRVRRFKGIDTEGRQQRNGCLAGTTCHGLGNVDCRSTTLAS